MMEIFKAMVEKRKTGEPFGIPSFCTANDFVLRTILKNAKSNHRMTMIEITSNQINQEGGYIGMNTFEFVDYLKKLCLEIDCPKELIRIGGDHLGPLPWSNEKTSVAMKKAEELVRMSVKAGLSKIHIDTTMRLADDPPVLHLNTIVERSVKLYKASIDEYQSIKQSDPDAIHPIFVIGSEVPYAGGIRDLNEKVLVTSPESVNDMLNAFDLAFQKEGLDNAWDYIKALVVQPGVDFGADRVQIYNHDNMKCLKECLKRFPNIVFEGHSTDYQTEASLNTMVEDGISVLKVGPALTMAFKESLFGLSFIEEIMIKNDKSNIRSIINNVMLEQNDYWKNHYHGDDKLLEIFRTYALSDRCRYYLNEPSVQESIRRLESNLQAKEIPLGLIHQFFPDQFDKIISGEIERNASSLVEASIDDVIEKYCRATKIDNYSVS